MSEVTQAKHLIEIAVDMLQEKQEKIEKEEDWHIINEGDFKDIIERLNRIIHELE